MISYARHQVFASSLSFVRSSNNLNVLSSTTRWSQTIGFFFSAGCWTPYEDPALMRRAAYVELPR